MQRLTLIILAFLLVTGCKSNTTKTDKQMDINSNGIETDTATFAAGCFWCVEAVFQELKGVLSVTSGYTGGKIKNPSYREVCSGLTGHAEACQIIYDPKVISYDELLEAFWASHDPTTLNRQGADQGTQYRSAIFYHNENQKELAEAYKAKFLAVTYDRFEFSGVEKVADISLQYHLRNIIIRILVSFLSYVSENQDLIKKLSDEEKKLLTIFILIT